MILGDIIEGKEITINLLLEFAEYHKDLLEEYLEEKKPRSEKSKLFDKKLQENIYNKLLKLN